MHIDTAPVWEAYRSDCECPVCLLQKKAESVSVAYFLGESVMDPDQRIEVNRKGFCGAHFKRMYDEGNRLGLALMAHTHLKETIRAQKALGERLIAEDGGFGLFKGASRKRSEALDTLLNLDDSCALCERVRDSVQRYIYTIIYMYVHEPDFPGLFSESKGMCLRHYGETLAMAREELSGKRRENFVRAMVDVETRSLERLEGEIDWFTKKFDCRNSDKPWGSSRDAVKRTINKLRTQVIED